MIKLLRHIAHIRLKQSNKFFQMHLLINLKVQKRLIPYGPERRKTQDVIFAIQYIF